MKLSQIRRRIELCMREMIVRQIYRVMQKKSARKSIYKENRSYVIKHQTTIENTAKWKHPE
jgi:hypothetical protein